MNRLSKIRRMLWQLLTLPRQVDELRRSVGRLEHELHLARPRASLRDYEFKVYSQFGEDGILQYLAHKLELERSTFVEFGVEDYTEANTRFLLMNNHWAGLVLDGSPSAVAAIQADPVRYRHSLQAACAFINRDNINDLIARHGLRGEIGVLSVDIDGNDYWVWEAVTVVSPCIVVCEYNSLFGARRKVSIPYAADFVRGQAHYSNVYYGASLAALAHLGARKGYTLVGTNSAGNNAFWVRNDRLGDLPAVTPEAGHTPARFRESRDSQGRHTFLDLEQCRQLIADLPLVDVETGAQLTVKET